MSSFLLSNPPPLARDVSSASILDDFDLPGRGTAGIIGIHTYSDELILFSDANWWTTLSHAILERNPDIEVTSLRSKHGKPCKVLHIQRM